jgi:hypothetical protein
LLGAAPRGVPCRLFAGNVRTPWKTMGDHRLKFNEPSGEKTMRHWPLLIFLAGIGILSSAPLCRADDEDNPVKKIVLHPAAEPRPALKYQFVFPVGERRATNAALLYDRILAERTQVFGADVKFWEELEKWSHAPLADLRNADVRRKIRQFRDIANCLHEAAQSETCDWQFLVPGKNYYETLLPDTQQSRAFARILAPYVRWQMAEGNYDDAVDSFRSGYLCARNVGSGPFLVCSLVGAAVAGVMNGQAEQFIQLPDAPNLYWAFASMPRPLVDFRPAWESEMDSMYISFPELRVLDKKNYPPEYYRYLLDQMTRKLAGFMNFKSDYLDALRTAAILEGYPRAKRYLIAHGRSAAEVDAMPVPQVVLLYTMQFYNEARDEVFKWTYLPYSESHKRAEQFEQRLREIARTREEVIPLASLFLPALSAAKIAEARIERDLDALQILEALRLYAANHDGRLPDRLADITEVPLPTDPLTSQPFIYHREGTTAFLDSFGPQPTSNLRYQIEMRPVK